MTTYFNIVHHISGRIRLRLSPSLLAQPLARDAQKLTQQILAINGIDEIRLNPMVGSVVIEYNPAIIQPALWEQWVREYDQDSKLENLLQNWQTHCELATEKHSRVSSNY